MAAPGRGWLTLPASRAPGDPLTWHSATHHAIGSTGGPEELLTSAGISLAFLAGKHNNGSLFPQICSNLSFGSPAKQAAEVDPSKSLAGAPTHPHGAEQPAVGRRAQCCRKLEGEGAPSAEQGGAGLGEVQAK